MEPKRLIVLVLIGLVVGGGVFAAILLFGPGTGATESTSTGPGAVEAKPLAPIDATLINAGAPTQPTPIRFIEPGKGAAKVVGTLKEGEQVTQLGFMPDGNYLVAIDYMDRYVRVWDWRAGTVASKARNEHLLTGLAVSPDGMGVWTGDAYANLCWWPVTGGKVGAAVRVGGDLGGHVHVAVSPNGRLVATSSYDKVLSVWDAAGRKLLARLSTEEQLRECAFSPDGKRLVVGTSTNLLLEYQLATGQGRKVQIMTVTPETDLMAVAFSPDGKRFSTGHTQPYITIWEGDSLTYRHWLKCPMAAIPALAYTRDSALVAFVVAKSTTVANSEVHLWNPDVAAEGGNIAVLKGHEASIGTLAFSPDGRVLASGDDGGTIQLWSSAD